MADPNTDPQASGQARSAWRWLWHGWILSMAGGLALLILLSVLAARGRALNTDVDAFRWQIHLHQQYGLSFYTDMLDQNMPGSFAFYQTIATLFGNTTFGFQLANLLLTIAMAWLFWLLLQPFDWRARLIGLLWYPAIYLWQGEHLLQRDVVLILPITAAVVIAAHGHWWRGCWWLRALIMGGVIGLGMAIKPQIGLMIILLSIYDESTAADAGQLPFKARCLRAVGRFVLGCLAALLPLMLVFAWLGWAGGITGFVEVVRRLWPVYTKFFFYDQAEYATGLREWVIRYRIFSTFEAYWWPIYLVMPAAMVGLYRALDCGHCPQRRRVALLVTATACLLLLQVLLVGQHWKHVYEPMLAMGCLLAVMGLTGPVPGPLSHQRFLPMLLVGAAVIFMATNAPIRRTLSAIGGPADSSAVSIWLARQTRPGDRVQLLSSDIALVRAAHEADLIPATRFGVPAFLVIGPHTPQTRQFQQQFIEQLQHQPPPWLLQSTDMTLGIRYPGQQQPAMARFEQHLKTWIDKHYQPVAQHGEVQLFGYRKTTTRP